jgi:Secretion system C-terminal sorting domain
MKKIYFFLVAIVATLSVNAQNDTLLYEGFEKGIFGKMIKEPTGKDLEWVNWDEDNVVPGEGKNSNWYLAPEAYQAQVTKPAVYNQTAHSLSWLKNEAFGSKNILITPPISIIDDKSTLSWQSCPLQGPEFMDGYKVLITVTSNDVKTAKPDTAFVAAEVTSYYTNGIKPFDLKDWKFSKGRIHANGYTNNKYWDTTNVKAFYRGRLEPHTVSLAKYKGKKIYVHFYHDSNDDYILELDNILVRGNQPAVVNTQDAFANNIRLVTYPNPTVNYMNVLYRLEKPSDVSIDVVDIQGKMVQKLFTGTQINGEMNHDFDVSQLSAGTYLLQVKVGEKVATQKFVKEN